MRIISALHSHTIVTVEGIDMPQVFAREVTPLAQAIQGHTAVQRFNGGPPIPRECPGIIVHDGAEVVRNSLGTGNARAHFAKVAFCPY